MSLLDPARLEAMDGRNRSHAAQMRARPVDRVAQPNPGLNLLFEYGQSNREGAGAAPPLSTRAVEGNLMLGRDVRPASSRESFDVNGEAGLQPLLARAVDSKARLLEPDEVAAHPDRDRLRGETPGVAAANLLAVLTRRAHPEAGAAMRLLVANGAVGGRSIDHLAREPGLGDIRYYGRYLDLLDRLKALQQDFQVLAIGWSQGEAEYIRQGLSLTSADYLAKLQGLQADMTADATAASGQAAPPAFIAWQPGGSHTKDRNPAGDLELISAMAAWRFAQETRGVWLAGPLYAFSQKGGHLDARGARDCGLKEALVLHRILNQGRHWAPLAPVEIEHEGQNLLIHYDVPSPPLRWAKAPGQAALMPSRGFTVRNERGRVLPIETPQIVAPTVVRLRLPEPHRLALTCWYADRFGPADGSGAIHDGRGNLCDSDDGGPAAAPEVLDAAGVDPGLLPEADRLANWGIAWSLPAPWRAADLG